MSKRKGTHIKILLMQEDITQTQIAKVLGVTHGAVSQVINGHENNPRIRQAIAQAVRRPIQELWPEPEADKPAA